MRVPASPAFLTPPSQIITALSRSIVPVMNSFLIMGIFLCICENIWPALYHQYMTLFDHYMGRI